MPQGTLDASKTGFAGLDQGARPLPNTLKYVKSLLEDNMGCIEFVERLRNTDALHQDKLYLTNENYGNGVEPIGLYFGKQRSKILLQIFGGIVQ